MSLNKFALILDEGPIARSYLQYLSDNKIKINELIYLGSKTLFFFKSIYINYNFNYINYKPRKFLKNTKVVRLIERVEELFKIRKNFFLDVYNFHNLNELCNQFYYCNSKRINSENCQEIIKNINSKIILNTGKQILKEILDLNKQFLHIHPGYLPTVKGADGSLWMLKKFNYLGVSSFIMNKKIDEGKIILREKIAIKELNVLNDDFNEQDLNDIWFSFVDPAIRVYHLKKLINKILSNKLSGNTYNNEESNYYSFMNKNDKSEILKKILIK